MRHQTTTTEIMEFLKDNMVTKEDAKQFATKDDIKEIWRVMATKDDVFRLEMNTKEEFKRYATRDDLVEMESRLTGHIVGFTKSIDTFDTELTAQRSRIDRLERRTGITEA